MLARLFSRQKTAEPSVVIVKMFAKFQPIFRHELFEEPIDQALAQARLGEVVGGGTALTPDGGIEFCDIQIGVTGDLDTALGVIRSTLIKRGAPRDTELSIEGSDARPMPIYV